MISIVSTCESWAANKLEKSCGQPWGEADSGKSRTPLPELPSHLVGSDPATWHHFNNMGSDGKWWEVMGSDGKWWEVMGSDGKWWEVMGSDGKWWEVLILSGWRVNTWNSEGSNWGFPAISSSLSSNRTKNKGPDRGFVWFCGQAMHLPARSAHYALGSPTGDLDPSSGNAIFCCGTNVFWWYVKIHVPPDLTKVGGFIFGNGNSRILKFRYCAI